MGLRLFHQAVAELIVLVGGLVYILSTAGGCSLGEEPAAFIDGWGVDTLHPHFNAREHSSSEVVPLRCSSVEVQHNSRSVWIKFYFCE